MYVLLLLGCNRFEKKVMLVPTNINNYDAQGLDIRHYNTNMDLFRQMNSSIYILFYGQSQALLASCICYVKLYE